MVRVRKELGYVGLGLCGLGVVLAVASAIMAQNHPERIIPLLVAGMAVYLPGGLMAVGAFGYKRFSPVYISLMMMRLLFAISVVISIISLAQPKR